MKKVLFISLGLAIIVGVGFFAVRVETAKSQAGPEIIEVDVYTSANRLNIQIETNISTTATVSYGTTSGNYSDTVSGTSTGTNHNISIENLEYNTTYYYQIEVKDVNGNSAQSEEFSMTTPLDYLIIKEVNVLDVANDKAYISASFNSHAWGSRAVRG